MGLLYDLIQVMLVAGSLTASGIISIGKGWKRRDDQVQAGSWGQEERLQGLLEDVRFTIESEAAHCV